MEDNQVWYYDGLINGGQMENMRPLNADPATLKVDETHTQLMSRVWLRK
jgi:hypothetical protein